MDEVLKRINENNNNNNNNNDCDVESLEFYLKLIYLWMANCNDALILTKKEKFKSKIENLNNLLNDLYFNSKTEKIREIILLIISEGFEELNFDLESQLKWFIEIFDYQTKRKISDDKSAKNIINLEQKILKNYFNKQFFHSILIKFDFTNQNLFIINNFNKINVVKCFKAHPIKMKNKTRLILKPKIYFFNAKNYQIPFYYIFFENNINFKNFNDFKEIKFDFDNNEISNEKNSANVVYKGISFDKKLSKLNNVLKTIPIEKNLLYFNYFQFDNKNLFQKFKNFLLNNFNNKNIIDLLFKLQISCVCDINNLINEKINFKEIFSNYNLNNLDKNQVLSKKEEIINLFNENNIYSIYQNYYDKISSLILNFCSIENIPLFYNTNLLQIFQTFLYSLYSKFPYFSLNILTSIDTNLKKIINFFTKNFLSNYEITDIKQPGIIYSKEINFEFILTSNEMTSINLVVPYPNDFAENDNENKIKSDNIFCVEIKLDLNGNTNNSLNNDLIIISDEHGYKNLKSNYMNYIFNYGTFFNLKLNNEINKNKIYLKGNEIKIISPSEIKYINKNKNDAFYSNSFVNNNNNKNVENLKQKFVLKIKIYPFNDFNINLKHFDNNVNNIHVLNQIILITQSLYFMTFKINNNLLNSFEITANENKIFHKNLILNLGLNDDFINNNKNENEIEIYSKKFFFDTKNYETFFEKKHINFSIPKNHILKEEITTKILNEIRKIINEPLTYNNIKKLPKFKEHINNYKKFEIIFLNMLIYHLKLFEINNENFTIDFNLIEPFYQLLGLILNKILNYICNKINVLKDCFNITKNLCEDFIKDYNNLQIELKNEIIDDLNKNSNNINVVQTKKKPKKN